MLYIIFFDFYAQYSHSLLSYKHHFTLTLPDRPLPRIEMGVKRPYLEQPPSEEEFFIALLENEWSVCSVISYDENSNTIKAHLLQAIKTRAKDDTGKTYWIYSEEENVDTFEEKNVLAMRPFINLAKNIKKRSCFCSYESRSH